MAPKNKIISSNWESFQLKILLIR